MTEKEMAAMIDSTNLNPCAVKKDIEQLCSDAVDYGFASVCVNPSYVPLAASLLDGKSSAVCTVVGFPLGANSASDKARQAAAVVSEGADEVDMVVNLGLVKDGDWSGVCGEISAVRRAVDEAMSGRGKKIVLKVILETCVLSDDEIAGCCQCAVRAGADFVKTSTGFAVLKDEAGNTFPNGATVHAVELMRRTVGGTLGVKASGGIHSWDEACALVSAGATRIGTSSAVSVVKKPAHS